ncbi:MAG: 16S rRNA (guanine(527)-N(7))-methyltransferase RsmG [Pseudomonadota bacterium]
MTPERISDLVGADVSRETIDRLEVYRLALLKWSKSINLVSRASLDAAQFRHFDDSLQVLAAAPEAETWVDLGSGGGFPGLVVGIVAAEIRPHTRMTLIESDQRKAEFLRHVSRETKVDVRVLSQRIEEAPPQHVQIVSARALADLDTLLGYAVRHLADSGTCLFLKGARATAEIIDSQKRWSYDVEQIPSRTDPEGVLLKIEGVQRV